MSARDATSLLKHSFKLSLYEAKAYLALLRGASEPKSLSRLGRIPLPRIYDTLGSLEAKGFVIRSGERYIPVGPKIALEGRIQQFEAEYHRDKASRVNAKDQLLQSLKVQLREDGHPGEIAMLRGINNIANKFSDVLSQSKSVILTVKKAFEARDLFMGYLASASSKEKKKIRIIVPTELQIPRDDSSVLKGLGVETRKMDNILLDLMVSDTDDVVIGVPDPLSEEAYHAVAIWTKNSSFAYSLRSSLDDLWRRSSKSA